MKKMAHMVIYGLSFLSLSAFLTAKIFFREASAVKIMLSAAEQMQTALHYLRLCREKKGLSFDLAIDPNRTGLIGLRNSILTTTIGQLEAKRTTTNPDFAGLIAYLLKKAGVKENEVIAIGASSSFPALIIASLAAAKALKLTPLYIVSLAASQWGANDPNFTWLDMQDCLEKAAWLPSKPVAVSLGGVRDIGLGLTYEAKEFLLREIERRKLNLIYEPDLDKNIALRLKFYETASQGQRIAAFINIGGGWANMGESEEILRLPPGLNIIDHRVAQPKGIVWEMARRKIPVIHLLYIKGLTEKYGLPWDPQPLPEKGKSRFYELARASSHNFKIIALLYLGIVGLLLLLYRLKVPFTGP